MGFRKTLFALCAASLAAPPGLVSAESADVLPEGSSVVYSGVAASTFDKGVNGAQRDRQVRSRADLYGAFGLTDRVQLSIDAPLVYNTFIDDPAQGPCPREGDDYCDPVFSLGEAGVHLRAQPIKGPISLSVGVGVRSDAWNADTRSRWTNIGYGTTSLVGSLIVGKTLSAVPLGFNAWGHYSLVFGREVTTALGTERFPKDLVSGGAEVWGRFKGLTLTGGASAMTRLGGVDADSVWLDYYVPTDDLWAVLRYKEVRAEGKLSVSLPNNSGLHLYASRVLWVDNGPSNSTDISLGWHRWFPAR